MDKASIALLTYGATILLLCSCAVFILHFTLAKAMRDRVPVYYFMLVFVALSLGFLAFVSRSFIPAWLSIVLTNALTLISVYAFRSALLWRRGNYIHLYRDRIAITNVLILIVVNTVFFHLWMDEFYYRVVILLSNLCIVLLSMRKYVGVDPQRITQGEKQTSVGLLLAAMLVISELVISPFIQDPWFYATYILAVTSLTTMLLLGVALNLVLSDIIETHYQNSITDILTGLYNRRYFMSQFLIAMNQSRRYHSPISVLICDIDHFKDINDQYGHDNGDLALQSFSEMLKTSVRDVDVVARYGGEEFIILMPQTPLGDAKQIAERLRVNTEKLCVMSKKKVFGFTVSIGLSSGEADFDVKDYIKLADEALYHAKHDGRNRVFSVRA
ncbi:hypothetical protein A9Q81_27020 [Gammaproteobacteria bacterium 42_54_T18]|nr:hypothetical protein A9Q81_27020 [Gammaproteobacteria bacterium 42_54_T18]